MSYTPGPWDFCDGEVFTKGGEASVALIQDQDADIAEANACLIAAAPELLENLIDMVRRFEGCLITNGTDKEFAKSATVHARAAIAKATGERTAAGLRLP